MWNIECSSHKFQRGTKIDREPSTHRNAPSLDFELHGVEGGLGKMDVGVVGVDHQFAIRPLGIFVSADEEGQGELFEHGVIKSLKPNPPKRAPDE